MKPLFSLALLPLVFSTASALSDLPAPPPTIAVEVTNPQLTPSKWSLNFTEEGWADFDSQADASAPQPGQPAYGKLHRRFQLSPEFTAHAFQVARQHKLFNFPCESHMKVAFQGAKRLSYRGNEGAGSCEFNYAKEKSIQELAEALMAVETTVLYGVRLEGLLQHDRLGLDQEMESLAAAAQSHTAIELGAIRPILTQLAGDDQVLERARRKARLLLAQAP